MSDGLMWLCLIVFSIAIVVFFSHRERRLFVKNREPASIEGMHSSIFEQVSLDVFRDVFVMLGDSYSLDPRLIRPDDSLQDFVRHDSWRLDIGTEKFNQWLIMNGLDTEPIHAQTVLELCRIIEEARERDRSG